MESILTWPEHPSFPLRVMITSKRNLRGIELGFVSDGFSRVPPSSARVNARVRDGGVVIGLRDRDRG